MWNSSINRGKNGEIDRLVVVKKKKNRVIRQSVVRKIAKFLNWWQEIFRMLSIGREETPWNSPMGRWKISRNLSIDSMKIFQNSSVDRGEKNHKIFQSDAGRKSGFLSICPRKKQWNSPIGHENYFETYQSILGENCEIRQSVAGKILKNCH